MLKIITPWGVLMAFFMSPCVFAMDKVVLQLRWDHQFQFAGYYAAKLNKYYEEAGLDVEVRSVISKDGKILRPVDEVSSGRAQFGVGAADILVANDTDKPLMVSAVIFQQSAAAFYAKKGTPFSSPRDFTHLKVARNIDDLIDVELQAMLRAEGIDPKEVKAYPHQSGIAHLLSGAVDVLPGYSITFPFDMAHAGNDYVHIDPASYGVDFYGDSLFVTARLARENPDLVTRFTQASLKGWRYALEHSEEIALKITSDFPRQSTDVREVEFNRFQIAGVRQLTHYPIVELGHVNPGRWAAMHSALKTSGLVHTKFDADAFVFDPERDQLVNDAKARRWLMLSVVLLGGAGLIAFGFIRVLRSQVNARTIELSSEISERKQAEEQLRHNTERTRRILRAATVGLWEWNLSTDVVYFSSEWKHQLGYADEEIANHIDEWRKRIHPNDVARAQSAIEDVRSGRTARYSVQIRLLHRDGSWRWIHGDGDVLRSAKGEPLMMMGSQIDITERKQAEIALIAAKEKAETAYHELFSSNERLDVSNAALAQAQRLGRIGSWSWNVAEDLTIWSDELFRIFGREPSPNAPSLAEHATFYTSDSLIRMQAAVRSALADGHAYELELEFLRADGSAGWLEAKGEPVRDESGVVSNIRGTVQEISERKRAEAAIISAKKLVDDSLGRLVLAADSGRLGVWEWDLIAGSLLWDPWMYRLHGVEPSDKTETYELWASHLHPDDKEACEIASQEAISGVRPYDTEFRIIWRDGSVHYLRATARVTRDDQGKALRMIGVNWDITELKENQRQLEYIAHYDALTKLPNRVLLADRLQQAMAQCKRRGQMLAVAYLDIDGFKAINDRHGHSVGDQFLIELAVLMKGVLREGDTLARMGGDEFVAILAELHQVQDCEPVLQRLLAAASTAITLSEGTHKVSASIGVTLYPQDDVDADQLLRHADQAMYVAKGEGKNRYRLFDVVQDTESKRHRESLDSIRSAIDHNEFVLYYQPKVNVKTGEVVGAEALIRWQHPQRGLLAPGLFLPLIEGQEISVELGDWVINTALTQISTWRAAGLDMAVSVNVSAHQLQGNEFVAKLTKALAEHPDIPPAQLELEILETSALEDVAQVSELMHTCKGLGVSFALDDFGTGYSSLTYLKRLPAGLLKIDQGFVRDMLIDSDDLAIVQGVISLAKVFKREVIAEGVETEAHARKLLELGCKLAQGYGVARAMPAADLPSWVEHWHAKAVWTA